MDSKLLQKKRKNSFDKELKIKNRKNSIESNNSKEKKEIKQANIRKLSNISNKSEASKKSAESEDVKIEKTSFFQDEITLRENKTLQSTQWRNRQRTLILASRGITGGERNLMNSLISLLPHSKKESKIERKVAFSELNELCFNNACSNCIYFEKRKRELVCWVFRSPEGPTFKFQVNNIHSIEEPKMAGNCLKFSRPLVCFDGTFEESEHMSLIKELFSNIFSTPKCHPKSKPFHDHSLNFYNFKNEIFFRNYQIVNDMKERFCNDDDASKMILVEIGPRFSLKLIKIFEGTMGGKTLYENPLYVSPAILIKRNASKFKMRQLRLLEKEEYLKERTKDKVDLSTRWVNEIN